MSAYRFETTVEPQKITQIMALPGTEWAGHLSVEEFAEVESKKLVDFILKGNPGRCFYLTTKDGDTVATCSVTQHKALYKGASFGGVGNVPDPALFGVSNITAIRVSHVFVHPDCRKQGLMALLLKKAMEYTEKEILKKELAKSSDSKDSFKLMVSNGKGVDEGLVRHYLGKKYVWFLYSAVGEAYGKLGFKGYPIEGYKIEGTNAEAAEYVEKLLDGEERGKKLRFLDATKQGDRDLLNHILQGHELDLLTDLNKSSFHSELQGNSRSSLSLTNLQGALSSARLGSFNELSAITEQLEKQNIASAEGQSEKTHPDSQGRRKSSVVNLGCARFAVLPKLEILDQHARSASVSAQKAGTAENERYAHIYGAVLTNELQRKLMYVVWSRNLQLQFFIVGMGELKLDLFGAMTDPTGLTNPVGRRRGSSFTGINEMGGLNFQDMEILVACASYAAQKNAVKNDDKSVYVGIQDLPNTVGGPVLHDFFTNYLPKAFADKGPGGSARVQYVRDFTSLKVLPMLRKYGGSDPRFDLDWVCNSMVSWS